MMICYDEVGSGVYHMPTEICGVVVMVWLWLWFVVVFVVWLLERKGDWCIHARRVSTSFVDRESGSRDEKRVMVERVVFLQA
jgi:hypothetical protein